MRRIQSTVGEAVYDVVINGSSLQINGEETDWDITRIDDKTIHIIADGKCIPATIDRQQNGVIRVHLNGSALDVKTQSRREVLLAKYGLKEGSMERVSTVTAPMPGLALKVLVEPGASVQKGQGVVVLEAMKMENELKAGSDGVVDKVLIKAGDPVAKGQKLVTFQ